jgi:hypothetical protein
MANIKISALLPVGYDLFNDAASFLNELATDEVQNVLGGGGWGHGGWGGNSGCYIPRCCWSCC